MDNTMINAKISVLTGLFLLGLNGVAVAANSVSGMSQQELNKLGQQTAKTNKVHDNFKVNDDSLRQINPDYAQTDLVSTYNSNRPANEQGSAKKWQCLSFTDDQIAQMYKSADVSKKQLATECDPIRAAEKTNDTMDGRYGDPLENELVRLFTARQNEQINNATKGDVNIECSPLGGTAGAAREEVCVINTIPEEKTCVRSLKVVCYNAETGKLLDGTEVCGTDKLPPKSISSLGGWGTSNRPKQKMWNSYEDYTSKQAGSEELKNTVYANFRFLDGFMEKLAGGERNPHVIFNFKIDQSIHPQAFIKYMNVTIRDDQNHVQAPRIFINDTEVQSPLGRSGTYNDADGKIMLGANLFKNGENSVRVTSYIRESNPFKRELMTISLAIGFKNKCTEVICEESWEESCVDRGFLDTDETFEE